MKDQPLTPEEERLTRWLDGQPGAPPPGDADAGAWQREKASADALGALLRRHAPLDVEPPYPDFFHSQVMKKLREETDGAARPSRAAAGARWFDWLRSPWFSGLAAASAAVLLMVALGPGATAAPKGTRVVSVFSPEPNAVATAIDSRDVQAVIIDVTGLENYPDDRLIVGLDPTEEEALVASLAR